MPFSLSLRLHRGVVRVIFPLIMVLLLFITLISYAEMDSSFIDRKYASILAFHNGDTASLLSGLSGNTFAPHNVVFKFKPTKKGTREEILARNKKVYDDVLAQPIHEPKDYDMELIRPPENILTYARANATIIALVRNGHVDGIRRTMQLFEQSFNAKFQYPYTFLNDEPFTEDFMREVRTSTKAPVDFVRVPPEIWNKPASIDVARQAKAMQYLEMEDVQHAKQESYHNMCRFYSGFFQDLPQLQKYKYYWRIEPDVQFYTNLNYDVFKYLAGTGKVYGFTINLYDSRQSVETLWMETLLFLNSGENNKYVHPNGAFQWITENQQNPLHAEHTKGYSTCHFWSNFEIADMDFYRSEAYSNWFKHLEATGKFYYERWGDAPVHSLGLALFADKRKIHWFRDIGYYHLPYTNCPNSKNTAGCTKGKFGTSMQLFDQNCLPTWIDYEMEHPQTIY